MRWSTYFEGLLLQIGFDKVQITIGHVIQGHVGLFELTDEPRQPMEPSFQPCRFLLTFGHGSRFVGEQRGASLQKIVDGLLDF